MASEILPVPEEHLAAVIAVIRAGLLGVDVDQEVAEHLTEWCDEEEAYLAELAEDDAENAAEEAFAERQQP